MPHPSLGLLFCALAGLLILAAFFAGSETALMSLNRYRLRHRASEGNRGARLAEALLAHPDRLIGLILLLSTIVNVAAPMLVGFIALRLGGEFLVAFGAATLTLVLLIFCEVAPKTFGALHPESLALPAAYIYTPLLLLLYPFVCATNRCWSAFWISRMPRWKTSWCPAMKSSASTSMTTGTAWSSSFVRASTRG